MSNYIEYKNSIAFHPGYYIKEIVEESGLTQEDFAKRLDTTPKNLSILIRGEQSLSIDIAMKLSRMVGTSVGYWLNLQNAFDSLIAEFKSEEELEKEKKIFKNFDYKFFKDFYGLPDFPRQTENQIHALRKFLQVSTLSVLKKRDMAVSFRSSGLNLSEANISKANAMVQIATNFALEVEAPKFNKKKFEEAVSFALKQTTNHKTFYTKIKKAFLESGVILTILPNISGSKTNGATKKIGDNILLMVNDRRLFADTFWFTLFHEIGHILNGDFGISFDSEVGSQESAADNYAENALIPPDTYKLFVKKRKFDVHSIQAFAKSIDRDPGIVVGRLQNDRFVSFDDWTLKPLKKKYKVVFSNNDN